MKRNPNVHADPSLRDAVDVTRFWGLVDRRSLDECWPWTGCLDRDGYGVFRWHGRTRPAHELALSFSTGEVRLKSLDTCHSCHNPSCCNPAHLRFDTRASNIADMYAAGRQHKGRLTDSEVALLRERRAAGATQRQLAKQFGVSEGYVSMIHSGARRSDAPGPIQPKKETKRK